MTTAAERFRAKLAQAISELEERWQAGTYTAAQAYELGKKLLERTQNHDPNLATLVALVRRIEGDPTLLAAQKTEADALERERPAAIAACRAFAKQPAKETAAEAVERYRAFHANLSRAVDPKTAARHAIVFHAKPIAKSEIASAEKRLGVTLPPSYVSFVTAHGLFSFGGGNEARLLPLDQLESVYDFHVELGWTVKQLAKAQRWKQAIGFSNGDEKLQIVAMYCFRFDAQDPRTKETPIFAFDQDEPEVIDEPVGKPKGKAFDIHIASLITEKIETLIEQYG